MQKTSADNLEYAGSELTWDEFMELREIVTGDRTNMPHNKYELVKVQISLPVKTASMLADKSKQRNKSLSMIINYFIWGGYFAERGEYKPPEKRVPK
jgi:hypothetical protein